MQYLLDYWKPIPNFEGLYEASFAGFVRSIAHRFPCTDKNGVVYDRSKSSYTLRYTYNRKNKKRAYRMLTLYKDAIQHKMLRSRIMALTFIPNQNNYPEVNHIDGIKMNDSPYNLEWCTAKYNTGHAISTGLRKAAPAFAHLGHLINQKIVLCLRTGVYFDSIKDFAASRNIAAKVVYRRINNQPLNPKIELDFILCS